MNSPFSRHSKHQPSFIQHSHMPYLLTFSSDPSKYAFCYDGKRGLIMTSSDCVDQCNEKNMSKFFLSVESSEFDKKSDTQKKNNKQESQRYKDQLDKATKYKLKFINGEEIDCVVLKGSSTHNIAVLKIIKSSNQENKVYPSFCLSQILDSQPAEIYSSFFPAWITNREASPIRIDSSGQIFVFDNRSEQQNDSNQIYNFMKNNQVLFSSNLLLKSNCVK